MFQSHSPFHTYEVHEESCAKRRIWESGSRGVPKAQKKAELWERREGA